MAQKRMFTMKIVDSDAFLDMPLSSQCLYYHLNMRADDDGFVGNPKKIMRMIGASEDDLKVLIAKKFLLYFDTGIVAIKHWWMHNTLAKDRYNETAYIEEKASLKIKDNKSYTFNTDDVKMLTNCYQNVNTDLDKISIDKNSIDTDTEKDTDINNTPSNEGARKKNNKAPLFDKIKEFTSNEELQNILNSFLKFKLSKTKNYNLEQWEIQLDMLKKYSCGDDTKAIEKVKSSYSKGYQSIVYENEIKQDFSTKENNGIIGNNSNLDEEILSQYFK